MPKYIVVKTFIIEAEDMEKAKEIAETLKNHRILEIDEMEEK